MVDLTHVNLLQDQDPKQEHKSAHEVIELSAMEPRQLKCHFVFDTQYTQKCIENKQLCFMKKQEQRKANSNGQVCDHTKMNQSTSHCPAIRRFPVAMELEENW
jgi:hypothetical protein